MNNYLNSPIRIGCVSSSQSEIEQYIEDNKGNATKRKYSSKTSARISAELPKGLVSEFRKIVAENNESSAGVIRKAVEKYVEDNE